jgi:hypothetical protein
MAVNFAKLPGLLAAGRFRGDLPKSKYQALILQWLGG